MLGPQGKHEIQTFIGINHGDDDRCFRPAVKGIEERGELPPVEVSLSKQVRPDRNVGGLYQDRLPVAFRAAFQLRTAEKQEKRFERRKLCQATLRDEQGVSPHTARPRHFGRVPGVRQRIGIDGLERIPGDVLLEPLRTTWTGEVA